MVSGKKSCGHGTPVVMDPQPPLADLTAGNMPRLSQVQPEPHPSAMDRQKGTGIGTEIGEL